MSEVSSIVTGLETRVSAVLGSGYSELGFVIDVSENNFKGSSSRYGVIAGDILQTENSGVLGSFTITQDFVIKVTKKWATSQAGDSSKRDVMVSLLENCILIYKDIVNNKAGSPSIVLNVLDGMNVVNTFHDEDNVCEATMTIQILYRKLL